MIIEHFDEVFNDRMQFASSADIAVGLICEKKAREIVRASKYEKTKIRLIVGVDMPTSNETLRFLMQEAENDDHLDVLYYSNKEKFFHPKVYMFDDPAGFFAYVGSANCTDSGFSTNCEMTIETTDKKDCEKLQKWFDSIWKNECSPITENMLNLREQEIEKNKYSPLPKMGKVKRISAHLDRFDDGEIISELLQLRNNTRIYNQICENRRQTIINLQRYLDVKNDFTGFRGENVNSFCEDGNLGDLNQHGVPQALHAAEARNRLKNFCKNLCDEEKPIEDRVKKALKNFDRVGQGVVTKILTAVYPKKYMLINGCSTKYLKIKNLTSGKKYSEYCEFGKTLCNRLNIDDFSVLDGLIRYAFDRKKN